jgi:hypothetical protein
MADYVLEVHDGEDEPPLRIELNGYSADDAETERRALATEIDHAVEIEAPLIYSGTTGSDPDSGVPIDPTRVTSVDLLDASADEG